ncbi:MAG: CPXCG motif-containing cysteine-rich protein [Gammaproteobacteria bacterium]|nr:CPXCG motif-containing cysteine-rich protein [Gammaproteobacteria bacterium]
MNELESVSVQCPYCWEKFDLLVDCSVEQQEYIEDCEVCCKPIDLVVTLDDSNKPQVVARHDSE